MTYGFNIQDFPEDQRQWLCDVLGRQFDEIYARGVLAGREQVSGPILTALGIR